MNLGIATVLAVSAAWATLLPLSAAAAPTVSFVTPSNGGTISGNIIQSSACEVRGSNIKQVRFFLNGAALNTENYSPWNCDIDTRRYNDGTHTLRAVAYDSAGASTSTQISVNIRNSTTAPAGPTVSFKTPTSGATLKGSIVQSSACEVVGSGIHRVVFFLGATQLNTENYSPWNCDIDTRKFADGTHTLKAVAYNSSGASSATQIPVTIRNSTTSTSTSPTTSTGPSVSFKTPTSGATLKGSIVQSSACEVTGSNIKQVRFYLGSTALNTENYSPWNCDIDTRKFADGAHTLMAVAFNPAGAQASTQVAVNIKNTSGSNPGSESSNPGSGGTLPSTGTRAVPTFESVGLYWTPGANPGAAGCKVQYRRQGESTWKDGLAMWFDSRNSECRGSLVHLTPGTNYEVQLALPGQQPSRGLSFKTWSESFPIAKTINVGSRSTTLNITEGGTPSGYVLYTGPGTIDVANAHDFNILISAPYVIVRGLTLKGARIHGIRMVKGAHNVVIENNDISGWGRDSGKVSSEGWKIGRDMDSGVYASCWNDTQWLERTIIQRNRIHHPRYGSNSWSDGHPSGPNAIMYTDCGGNHVFRYNEIYSEWSRYFMDGIGGGENFSTKGMPNADSDIYGNIIKHVWDDAIEAEGANNNVRIWGNYFDHTATGVATTATSKGPVYIWRNVWNRSRNKSRATLDNDNRLYMFKSGSASTYGDGRRYVFHNTMLQAPPPAGSSLPLGGGMGLMGPGGGQNLTNTVSRNNIYHVWKSWWRSISDNGGGGSPNDLDYDLVNGQINAYAGAAPNRIVGTPVYASGHGWSSEAGGRYQLAPSSPGYDRGVRIPNFNDSFTGAAPDMGAHEAGTPAMKLGVQ